MFTASSESKLKETSIKKIIVDQDRSVLFLPKKSEYQSLYPYFPQAGTHKEKATQAPHSLEQKAAVSLVATGINACHTVIAYEESTGNTFMLHVSPHSYRKGYKSSPEELTQYSAPTFGSFGMFGGGFDIDSAMTAACDPAYICLDPTKYKNFTLPVTKNTKLKLIIVVNNQHWSDDSAKKIVDKIKARTPAEVTTANIIVTEALEHGRGYSVSFDPTLQTLCVHGAGGIYNERYSKPFIQTAHDDAGALLPEKKRSELKQELGELIDDFDINGLISQGILRKPLSLNLSENIVEFKGFAEFKGCAAEAQKSINAIESIYKQSKNPAADFGSQNCFDCYMRLGGLYTLLGDFKKASRYLSLSADYAIAKHRCEYDGLASTFSLLAGLAYKELDSGEESLEYLLQVRYSDLSMAPVLFKAAEMGKKTPGYELEIARELVSLKSNLKYTIKAIEDKDPYCRMDISELPNVREWLKTSNALLKDYSETIEKYRSIYVGFQEEYDQRFGLICRP